MLLKVGDIFYIALVISCQVIHGIAGPTIISSEEDKTASPGHSVYFDCIVKDPGSETVRWLFLTHNMTISENGLLKHQSSKYSIQTDTSRGLFKLNIFNIEANDKGDYQCSIDGTIQKQVSHLHVAGTTIPSAPNGPPANFTDCCSQEGVSSYCIGLCSPSTFIKDNFNSSRCAKDLNKLLKCGADGRNHVTCCRQRNLPNYCLEYCYGDFPAIITTDQTECLKRALDIITCFQEGQLVLPGPPMNPKVVADSSTSIKVTWSVSAENGDKIEGYRVFHQKKGDTGFLSNEALDLHQSEFMIKGLMPSTEYNAYIIAYNKHGSSLPSYIVSTRTKPASPLPGNTDPLNLLNCCQRRAVSSKCQSFLCGGPYIHLTAQDKIQCYTQVERVYTCLAEEKDHRACCARRNIPVRCQTLCTGHLITTVFDNLDCIDLYMMDVSACIQEGKGTLPAPPDNITVSEVTSSTAVISWVPPTQHENVVYQLQYKDVNKQVYISHDVSGLRAELTALTSNTMYQVSVKSIRDKTSLSMASEIIMFLTYFDNGEVILNPQRPPSTTPAPPHDVAKCCDEQDVDTNCKQLCDYKANHTKFDTSFYFTCAPFVGDVLACGADGRNHEPCCTQRGIPTGCLKFCSFSKEQATAFKFNGVDIPCVDYLDKIVQCMQEGVASIPSEPVQLHVVTKTAHTITIMWSAPHQNPSKVTGYIIDVNNMNATNLGMSYIAGPVTQHIIQNLLPDQAYEIAVLSVSDAGESLPSVGLAVRTNPVKYEHLINVTMPDDLTECCKSKNMSSTCLPVCSGSSMVDLYTCGGEMGIVLECAADNRNHVPCCKRNNVPDHCLKLCEGKVTCVHCVNDFLSVLCMAYSEQLLSCFREGYDILPKTPDNFKVEDLSTRHVKVSWDVPTSPQEDLRYNLYYRLKFAKNFTFIQDIKTPYTQPDLMPFQHYELFLVAVNTHGTSLPTATFVIWTKLEEGPELHVNQEPSGILKEGTVGVVLKCESYTKPSPEIYWKRNDKIIKNSALVIQKLSRNDQGRYTCVGNSVHGIKSVRDLHLKVQYQITATPLKKRVDVAPHKGNLAQLQCDFRGYPIQINWYRKGQHPVPPLNDTSHRFTIRRTINPDEGYISSQLVITQLKKNDYGTYTCSGQNAFGRHFAQVDLINPEPDVTMPPITPAPAITDVTACCNNHNVSPTCLVACSFDIDFTQILALPSPGECIKDLPIITGCAADGRNHTQCCVNQQVPSQCLPYCLGIVTELDDSHFACISSFEKIIKCMEEGLDKIPNAPSGLRGKISQGYIQLLWDEPTKNPEYVTYYDIHYQGGKEGENKVETVGHQVLHVMLKAIHSFTTYRIYVVARNHHGQSHPSLNITITTQELLPSVPENLFGSVVKQTGIDIFLRWDAPVKNPGAVVQYVIYYRETSNSNGKRKQKLANAGKYSYTLLNLVENTNYEIYVTAKTAHFESEKSNIVTVHTLTTTTATEAQTGNKEAIGIGIGVAVAIIIVAAIAIVAVIVLFRMRESNKHQRFRDSTSVTFENSGFSKPAQVQISNMPGEAVAYSDSNMQPSDFEPREPSIEDSSIMKEVPDNTHTVSVDNNNSGGVGQTAINPLYATLNVEQPADEGSVNLGFNSNGKVA